MAIKYYPNRIQKRSEPAIDRVVAKRRVQRVSGIKDISSSALNAVISAGNDWQIDSIQLNFSTATARAYSAKILNGRKVITDLNDFLWFQTPDTIWQKITLTSNFYTGTALATELQTQLNANAAFTALGLTFTVAYTPATGLFTITPSSGTVKYIEHKVDFPLPDQYSIGGHLFGLNANTEFVSAITSDTAVYGLDSEAWIIDETASTVAEHYHDDIHILNVDQALHLGSSTAATVITYSASYEEIV